MEIMIVITMMMILSSIGMIPYGYYMDRAQVEKTLDMVSQEWILSHNSVRNGILYDTSKHADLYIKFESGAKNIEILLASGSTFSTTEKKNYKILSLESKIEILTFS